MADPRRDRMAPAVRPLTCPSPPIGPRMSWYLWLLAAAAAVLPVVLRAWAEGDEPGNAVTQEQDGGRGDAEMRRAA